jgi:dTDP-4-dehydrorhamnose 3,5-epimerase
MKVSTTTLPGVLVIEPAVFADARGDFMETFNARRYAEHGIPGPFVQDNQSLSAPDVLRGLHFQNPNAQDKLVHVVRGAVFDVAVDIRVGSPTFGRWTGAELSDENRRQMYIPGGFAHGFCVIRGPAVFSYKCTAFYDSSAEKTIAWNDPAIGVDWPVGQPVVSDRDAAALNLRDLDPEALPRFSAAA